MSKINTEEDCIIETYDKVTIESLYVQNKVMIRGIYDYELCLKNEIHLQETMQHMISSTERITDKM